MTQHLQHLNYVRHIASLFANDQQPEELVLDNAFSELHEHVTALCQDRDGSAQLEVLLRHSHVTHLTALVEVLLSTWVELMAHVFASHVLDALLQQLQHCMTAEHVTGADYQSGLKLVAQIVTCLTDPEHRATLSEHWRHVLTSKYGSYSLRHTYSLVHALLGHATKRGKRDAQAKLTRHLSQLMTAITWSTDAKYLIDTCHHEATAHVIEHVLEIAADTGVQVERADHVPQSAYLWLVDTLLSSPGPAHVTGEHVTGEHVTDAAPALTEAEHVTDILKRAKHAVWSHVLIAILKHVTALKSSDTWHWAALYQKYFRTRLIALCAHPVANFVVQSLIATSSTEAHWRMLFTEMEPQFGELLDGRLGVVLNLVTSAVTHVNVQPDLVKAVVKLLSALTAKNLAAKNSPVPDANGLAQETRKTVAALLLTIQNAPRHQYKKQRPQSERYSGIGCQLLSALFQLQHAVNQFVLQSFAALGVAEHVAMCQDLQASHVIEHFLDSRQVPLALKQTFIESLRGHYAELALDKYGSHCVDKCYQSSELSKKEMITKELLKHERDLSASFYGKHVLKNCRVEQYKKKKDTWRSKEAQNEKTRERFQEILATPTSEAEHVTEHETPSEPEHATKAGTKRKREDQVTGVKAAPAEQEDDIDRVFKKIKPNPRDRDDDELVVAPVASETRGDSDARLDNIVAALKKTKQVKSKKK